MNLLYRGAIGLLVAASVLAGCTSHSAVMPAQPAQVGSNAQTANLSISAGALASPDACTDPAKHKICVKPGGSYMIRLRMDCNVNDKPVNCGTVTWSTRIFMRLAATYKPNPGNPTVETIAAAKMAKLGHYTQIVHAHCTVPGVPRCDKDYFFEIWVI